VLARISGKDRLSLGSEARLVAAESRYDEALGCGVDTWGGWVGRAGNHPNDAVITASLSACDRQTNHSFGFTEQLFLIFEHAKFALAIRRSLAVLR
jgi:hypothetical protein